MAEQTHQSDPRVLNRRTLETDHRRLAPILMPGLEVLDIGCGSGAITAGIAKAVGSTGRVVGIDKDPSLLAIARKGGTPPQLSFVEGDVMKLGLDSQFDIVNASRTLQWVRDPHEAVKAMARAAKPGGLVVALDYNHAANTWNPDPPPMFRQFYAAFLGWREANGWDNHMADNLPRIFVEAGLTNITVQDSSETSGRGDAGSLIWLQVIESVGPSFWPDCARTQALYGDWLDHDLIRQDLSLQTVIGQCPS